MLALQELITRLEQNTAALDRLCTLISGFAPFAKDPRHTQRGYGHTQFAGMEAKAAGAPKDDA